MGQQESHAAQQREVLIFLRRNKPRHQYMQGADHLVNTLTKKDMEVLKVINLSISQQ